MVARGDLAWADLGDEGGGRRPVCVVTRDSAIPVRTRLTVAPVTTTVRRLRAEVEVGPSEGLARPSVVNCDNLVTIPARALDPVPLGRLDEAKRAELDRALRFALGIRH